MDDQKEEREIIKIEVTEEDLTYKRLDQFLAAKIPDISRNLQKKLFEEGCITSPSGKIELKKPPKLGMEIFLEVPLVTSTDLIAQDIPLNILFEDEYLVIIDKQAGLVVHPAVGNPDGTLVNAILHHCPDLKGIGFERRPGIVHRLDKGTSGVMVIAKQQQCHEQLVKMFSEHNLVRKYEALVVGNVISIHGKLESLIGRHPTNRVKMSTYCKEGRKSLTYYTVLKQVGPLFHVEFTLHTGRTHQIRVHSTELLNSALLGDGLYGNVAQQLSRLTPEVRNIFKDHPHPMLHAKHLEFIHPITKEKFIFTTKAPEPFQSILGTMYG